MERLTLTWLISWTIVFTPFQLPVLCSRVSSSNFKRKFGDVLRCLNNYFVSHVNLLALIMMLFMTAQLGKTLIVLIQHLTDSVGEVDNIVQWSWSAGSYELSDHALTRSSSNYELFVEKQENKVYFVKRRMKGDMNVITM